MLELSREIMAGLALGVFWLHALLIAAAAGQDLRALAGLRAALRPIAGLRDGAVGLLTGEIGSGEGPDGALACSIVAQIGRSKGGGEIYFGDAEHRSEIFAGSVETGGAAVRIEGDLGAVWPDPSARSAAAEQDPDLEFEQVEAEARRARGYRREVVTPLQVGRRVWIAGRLREVDDGWCLEPAIPALGRGVGRGPAGEPVVLISAIEPRRWLGVRCWSIVAFIVVELALAAGCTILALWPPLFGQLSMLGAAAALGFFLGVQPLGVALNEWSRTPDRAYLRGIWERPS